MDFLSTKSVTFLLCIIVVVVVLTTATVEMINAQVSINPGFTLAQSRNKFYSLLAVNYTFSTTFSIFLYSTSATPEFSYQCNISVRDAYNLDYTTSYNSDLDPLASNAWISETDAGSGGGLRQQRTCWNMTDATNIHRVNATSIPSYSVGLFVKSINEYFEDVADNEMAAIRDPTRANHVFYTPGSTYSPSSAKLDREQGSYPLLLQIHAPIADQIHFFKTQIRINSLLNVTENDIARYWARASNTDHYDQWLNNTEETDINTSYHFDLVVYDGREDQDNPLTPGNLQNLRAYRIGVNGISHRVERVIDVLTNTDVTEEDNTWSAELLMLGVPLTMEEHFSRLALAIDISTPTINGTNNFYAKYDPVKGFPSKYSWKNPFHDFGGARSHSGPSAGSIETVPPAINGGGNNNIILNPNMLRTWKISNVNPGPLEKPYPRILAAGAISLIIIVIIILIFVAYWQVKKKQEKDQQMNRNNILANSEERANSGSNNGVRRTANDIIPHQHGRFERRQQPTVAVDDLEMHNTSAFEEPVDGFKIDFGRKGGVDAAHMPV